VIGVPDAFGQAMKIMRAAPATNRAPDLMDLQQRLLRLAELVDRAIIGATGALANRDLGAAQSVVDGDTLIDGLRYVIEEQAVQLLAQPSLMLPDVRTISGLLLIAGELERIGDYAKGIATLVLRSAELMPPEAQLVPGQMARVAREMFQQAIRAVVKHDTKTAPQLKQTDAIIDRLYRQMRQELLATMRAQPGQIEWATYLLWIGHNLERIADRAVNIAERAAFIATGTRALA
jgi:phosphate transport system protein